MNTHTLLSIALTTLVLGCSTAQMSLDPSLALPARPPDRGDWNIASGIGMMPSYDPIAEVIGTPIGFMVAGGVTPFEGVTMRGRIWMSYHGSEIRRYYDWLFGGGWEEYTEYLTSGGTSLALLIRLDDRDDGWRWVVQPSFAWAFADDMFNVNEQLYMGMGSGATLAGLSLAAWAPLLGSFQQYGGIGLSAGWMDYGANDAYHPANVHSAWGVTVNVGTHFGVSAGGVRNPTTLFVELEAVIGAVSSNDLFVLPGVVIGLSF